MSTLLGTTALDFQNFYQSALTSDITDVATDIFIDTVPSVSEGILVIDPDSAANREIIYYTSKTGTKVVCPANGRGYDSSTAAAHSGGTKVIMAPVADWFNMLRTGQLGSADMRGGWLGAAETWTYASFASTVGTITVPSDATTKYSAGMKIRISQSTGGTKYGIITKVASTLLTVYFGTDYTLNNEAISSPCYSVQKSPYGFPIDPAKWTVTATSSSDRTTTSATYATLTDTITIPIGCWLFKTKISMRGISGSTSSLVAQITMSSDASTETNPKMTVVNFHRADGATQEIAGHTATASSYITLAASTTFTMMGKTNAESIVVTGSLGTPTVFEAVCAYL